MLFSSSIKSAKKHFTGLTSPLFFLKLHMKIVAMIPARYGATRFPGKLTSDLCGKPVIVRTYLSTIDRKSVV